MTLVPIEEGTVEQLAPQAIGPRNACSLDVKSEIRLGQHIDHIDAQPPRVGVQVFRYWFDVTCNGIGKALRDQARGASTILLLNQAALQAVIVQRVHATPSALLGIEGQPVTEVRIGYAGWLLDINTFCLVNFWRNKGFSSVLLWPVAED